MAGLPAHQSSRLPGDDEAAEWICRTDQQPTQPSVLVRFSPNSSISDNAARMKGSLIRNHFPVLTALTT
jgi:hypothetical protein